MGMVLTTPYTKLTNNDFCVTIYKKKQMTNYTKKQRSKNYNLQKSTSKIMDDLLSALTTATSNAYEFIKNTYNDLPINKTNDTLTKNVHAKKKAPVQNTSLYPMAQLIKIQ